MILKVSVLNIEKLLAKLEKFGEQIKPDLQEVIKGGGQLIRGEAIKSIQTGAKSGVVYQKYNPKRTHRASAPGQSPASDTGNLVSNIIVKQKDSNIVEVQSNANYSAYLEFCTSKMQPRPFMFPAFEVSKQPIIQATMNRVKKKIEEMAE